MGTILEEHARLAGMDRAQYLRVIITRQLTGVEIPSTPDWLREIHEESVRNETDQLTMADIDEEIAAARAARHQRKQQPRPD